MTSAAVLPLSLDGDVFAVVGCWAPDDHHYDALCLTRLTRVVDAVSMVLEATVRLHRMQAALEAVGPDTTAAFPCRHSIAPPQRDAPLSAPEPTDEAARRALDRDLRLGDMARRAALHHGSGSRTAEKTGAGPWSRQTRAFLAPVPSEGPRHDTAL